MSEPNWPADSSLPSLPSAARTHPTRPGPDSRREGGRARAADAGLIEARTESQDQEPQGDRAAWMGLGGWQRAQNPF